MPGKGAIFRFTTNSDEIPRLSFYSDDVIRYKANIVWNSYQASNDYQIFYSAQEY